MSMDYSGMPYGKAAIAGTKRRKKKYNGYKEKPNRYCFYHNTAGADRHEVYPAANRQLSIDNGFQVDLCKECHYEVTNNTKRGQQISKYWQRYYQRKYLDRLIANGMSEEDALKLWMNPKFIGRNYIEELEP